MILRLFKNDFIHGLLTNLVMMVFITVSSLLSCTSVSLIYNSMFQISYFMNDMGNTTELNFSMMNVSEQNQKNIIAFLNDKGIDEYEIEQDINIPINDLSLSGQEKVSCVGCNATTEPKTYNLIYDEDNQLPDIQEGYVGIPLSMKEQYGLVIGDTLTIKRKDQVFTYEIQSFIRDSLFGSGMMGTKRFVFHPSDFQS